MIRLRTMSCSLRIRISSSARFRSVISITPAIEPRNSPESSMNGDAISRAVMRSPSFLMNSHSYCSLMPSLRRVRRSCIVALQEGGINEWNGLPVISSGA